MATGLGLAYDVLLTAGVVLLGVGFFWKDRRAHLSRAAGWVVFGVFWFLHVPDYANQDDPLNALGAEREMEEDRGAAEAIREALDLAGIDVIVDHDDTPLVRRVEEALRPPAQEDRLEVERAVGGLDPDTVPRRTRIATGPAVYVSDNHKRDQEGCAAPPEAGAT